MRLLPLLALVSVLAASSAACSEAPASPVKEPFAELASAPNVDRSEPVSLLLAPTGTNVVPVAAAATASAADALVGHLEGPERLAHLYQGLAGLDAGHVHKDVRILQFGDSHTASDMGASAFRHALQSRFGDGGRGFVSIGLPWKTYVQDGVRSCGMSSRFEPARMRVAGQHGWGDGYFGLLGVGIGSSSVGANAWTAVSQRFSHVEVDYLQQPQGGSFDVFVDGAHAVRVNTRASQRASGFAGFEVADGGHQIDVRSAGDGDVRIFGMTLDRTQAGVVVDALGINGAQIFTPLSWNEEHFDEQVRHQAPDLVVLAYGTNEAVDERLTDADYERGLVDILGRVSRAAPSAACMLLGPPDLARWTRGTHGYHTAPRILEIAAIQRQVAKAAGCAFYDQIEAMGGPGSMAAWAAETMPRGQPDRMHLTRTGYAQVGTALATDVMHAYDEWRAEMGLPPTGSERSQNVARR